MSVLTSLQHGKPFHLSLLVSVKVCLSAVLIIFLTPVFQDIVIAHSGWLCHSSHGLDLNKWWPSPPAPGLRSCWQLHWGFLMNLSARVYQVNRGLQHSLCNFQKLSNSGMYRGLSQHFFLLFKVLNEFIGCPEIVADWLQYSLEMIGSQTLIKWFVIIYAKFPDCWYRLVDPASHSS